MEFTVLTDLSASIFAACFMILLIFLGLAQKEQAGRPPEPPRSIEATRDLAVTTRRPLHPAEMVDLLYRHGQAEDPSAAIDLFADRVEVSAGDGAEPVRFSSGALSDLSASLGGRATPIRLYVFSNDLYGATLAAIGARPHVELSVPRGLRDPQAPDDAWSSAFSDLGRAALERPAFRERLAVLLAGSAEPAGTAAGAGGGSSTDSTSAAPTGSSSIRAIGREFLRRLAIGLTTVGFAVAVWIRFRVRDVAFDTSEAGGPRLD